MRKKLYIIQNAQFNGNESLGLSEIGKQQALNIADYFRDVKLESLITSTSPICLDTLAPLAQLRGQQARQISDLNVQSSRYGSFESAEMCIQSWFSNQILSICQKNTAIVVETEALNYLLEYIEGFFLPLVRTDSASEAPSRQFAAIWEFEWKENRIVRYKMSNFPHNAVEQEITGVGAPKSHEEPTRIANSSKQPILR